MEALQELLRVCIILSLGVALGMGISAYHDIKEWIR